MTNEFDLNSTLQVEVALILSVFSLVFLVLAGCTLMKKNEPIRKKTLELNEEEFRENLECAKKGEIGHLEEKEVYEHFNE
jgi:hypothetical protein